MRTRTLTLLVAIVAAAAAAGAKRNVDEFNRQYAPLTCAITGECACPQAGTPVCAKCPFDTGSEWKDDKVCFCKNLKTGSGIECSAGREFSPKKVSVDGNGARGSGKSVSGTEGSHSAVVSDPEENEKGGFAVGAGVGIGLGAFAVLAVGCLGGWMLLGRWKGRAGRGMGSDMGHGMGMGSDRMGSGRMDKGEMMVDTSGGMSGSAEAEATRLDLSSSGDASPWLPPSTPGFMQKDYVNVTPPPLGDPLSAMTDSAGVGVQSTFLAADTPPPAEIVWDGRKERDILATTVGSGGLREAEGTGASPPMDESYARGDPINSLVTTAELGTTGGTGGTAGTAGSVVTE